MLFQIFPALIHIFRIWALPSTIILWRPFFWYCLVIDFLTILAFGYSANNVLFQACETIITFILPMAGFFMSAFSRLITDQWEPTNPSRWIILWLGQPISISDFKPPIFFFLLFFYFCILLLPRFQFIGQTSFINSFQYIIMLYFIICRFGYSTVTRMSWWLSFWEQIT